MIVTEGQSQGRRNLFKDENDGEDYVTITEKALSPLRPSKSRANGILNSVIIWENPRVIYIL